MKQRPFLWIVALWLGAATACLAAQKLPLEASDLVKLRSVGQVAVSPDGQRIAYTVIHNDGARPYSRLWILNLKDGNSVRVGSEKDSGSGPEWSPDGQWLAYQGRTGEKSGLIITRPDGTGVRLLAPIQSTNNRLPETGRQLTWAPDARQIAFLSAVAGPESNPAASDPVVITRLLYRPDASDGINRFADNRWLHVFLADLESGQARQLTEGSYHDHSIDWSPRGDEILFVSNRDPDQDRFFNYDVFAAKLDGGGIRRLTATEGSEYRPRWSPDGRTIVLQFTRRGITYLDTFMEDTHVWTMDASGGNRREVGVVIDNRQGEPRWDADGKSVYFTVQEHGNVKLYRLPISGGKPEVVVGSRGIVGSWSLAQNGVLAYSFASPSDLAQLYRKNPRQTAKALTTLNVELLDGKLLGEVEAFSFISHDHAYQIEAFLTKPAVLNSALKHPLVVNIHGGPHSQHGPAFQFKNQVYAGRGWATLMVNYRGSTSYGQRFADGIFGDQHGNEAQDVLSGVSAVLRRYLWLDRNRVVLDGASYGGGIATWMITQTGFFKAAIANAPITNPITYNYLTNNNQYVHMAYGLPPHQRNLLDRLWEGSAMRHVSSVRTPTLLIHGENDSDVPIVESEQFFAALKEVGVETVMVRYPREGHGIRETRHLIDLIERSIRWFETHFPATAR